MVDFKKIKTYPLSQRKNLERIGEFACPLGQAPFSLNALSEAMPKTLKARSLHEFVNNLKELHLSGRPIVLAIGGHVIKCGLNPLVVDLIERDIVKAICLNGSGIIHDYEFSLIGETSEDVTKTLAEGVFGMAEETSCHIFEAVEKGLNSGLGLGWSVGRMIEKRKNPHRGISIAAAAFRKKIPLTVHVAFGTDIIHQHPKFDPRLMGEATYRDFKTVCDVVAGLSSGGAWLNIGSAVILPEILLKALSVCTNLGHRFSSLITADFDMVDYYRPRTNVVFRPTISGGKGYQFIGHHEIMIPLLYAMLLDRLAS